MKLVNLTAHDITILRPDGDVTIHPSGVVARAEKKQAVVREVDGVPVVHNSYSGTVNLPDPVEGTGYLVSLMTAKAARDRADLFVVEDLVRTETGTVIGCRCLATLCERY